VKVKVTGDLCQEVPAPETVVMGGVGAGVGVGVDVGVGVGAGAWWLMLTIATAWVRSGWPEFW
jgi:hypothetical protein